MKIQILSEPLLLWMDEFLGDLDLIARASKDEDKNADQLIQETAWAINVERFKRDWPNLPAPPFLIGISAKFGMGKSSIICYLINKWLQYGLFKEIIYFSESGQVDDKMEIFCPPSNTDFSYSASNLDDHLGKVFEARGLPNPYKGGSAKDKKANVAKMAKDIAKGGMASQGGARRRKRTGANLSDDIFDKIGKTKIQAMLNKQVAPRVTNMEHFEEDLSSMTSKERISFAKSLISKEILLVFDDSSGQPILQRNSRWWPFMTMLRHLKASAMMAYHQFKQLGTTLRANMSVNITFPTDNPKEAEAIAEESGMNKKTFENLLRAVSRLGKGNYLVRYTDGRVRDRLLNFKAVLSPEMVVRVVEAEKNLGGQGDADQAVETPEGVDKERAIGGTPILMAALAGVPMDKTQSLTPVSAITPSVLTLTPAQAKSFPKSVEVIQRVEEIVVPTIADPAAMAAKLTLRSKPPPAMSRKRSYDGPTVGVGPTAKRPSSSQNREAAAGMLHPDGAVAGVLSRFAKRKTEAVRSATVSALRTQYAVTDRVADPGGAAVVAARLNAAARGIPRTVSRIAASQPGFDAARLISQAAQRAGNRQAARLGAPRPFKPIAANITRATRNPRRRFIVSQGRRGLNGGPADSALAFSQFASKIAAIENTLGTFIDDTTRARQNAAQQAKDAKAKAATDERLAKAQKATADAKQALKDFQQKPKETPAAAGPKPTLKQRGTQVNLRPDTGVGQVQTTATSTGVGQVQTDAAPSTGVGQVQTDTRSTGVGQVQTDAPPSMADGQTSTTNTDNTDMVSTTTVGRRSNGSSSSSSSPSEGGDFVSVNDGEDTILDISDMASAFGLGPVATAYNKKEGYTSSVTPYDYRSSMKVAFDPPPLVPQSVLQRRERPNTVSDLLAAGKDFGNAATTTGTGVVAGTLRGTALALQNMGPGVAQGIQDAGSGVGSLVGETLRFAGSAVNAGGTFASGVLGAASRTISALTPGPTHAGLLSGPTPTNNARIEVVEDYAPAGAITEGEGQVEEFVPAGLITQGGEGDTAAPRTKRKARVPQIVAGKGDRRRSRRLRKQSPR